jgi:Lrp/AsnC family leucine-responsive transcriptional regulator
MDAIDIKILGFLQENAKLTAKELADKLSLTPTPIYERIKKLERSGIIKKYVAIVDAEKVGKSISVFLNIVIKDHYKEKRAKLVEELKNLPSITELYFTSGSYDILAKVRFASISEYKSFLLDELSAFQNIADIDSQIVLEEVKYSTKIPKI